MPLSSKTSLILYFIKYILEIRSMYACTSLNTILNSWVCPEQKGHGKSQAKLKITVQPFSSLNTTTINCCEISYHNWTPGRQRAGAFWEDQCSSTASGPPVPLPVAPAVSDRRVILAHNNAKSNYGNIYVCKCTHRRNSRQSDCGHFLSPVQVKKDLQESKCSLTWKRSKYIQEIY